MTELEFSSTESMEHEPTVEEVLFACSDVLDENDREFVKDFDVEELLTYVSGKFDAAGKDPAEELFRRGFLESDVED